MHNDILRIEIMRTDRIYIYTHTVYIHVYLCSLLYIYICIIIIIIIIVIHGPTFAAPGAGLHKIIILA